MERCRFDSCSPELDPTRCKIKDAVCCHWDQYIQINNNKGKKRQLKAWCGKAGGVNVSEEVADTNMLQVIGWIR